MNRRRLLGSTAALTLTAGLRPIAAAARGRSRFRRVRPGEPGWPGAAAWGALGKAVGGRLVQVRSPWAAAAQAPASPETAALFRDLRNPYAINENVALTQTLGWTDAWTSRPSAYAIAATTPADVVAGVNFAREHRLRLVVKGGGHSYLGGSNAPDSLLIWTRGLKEIALHDGFLPQGGQGRAAPQPAVSLGAGVIWLEAYEAVTTRAGRYVQGGGCTTVGVAGLVQGGGFGSHSKGYGLAAQSLLEAELVTADGRLRVVNAFQEPDLFWALKGGGGGTFGVVTRLTLQTHDLPASFGAAQATIRAGSDAAFRALIARVVDHYAEALFNPHWGEQIRFHRPRTVDIGMVFQGLTQAEAAAAWKPLFDWVRARPQYYEMAAPIVAALPARMQWNGRVLKSLPGLLQPDDRPGATPDRFWWSGDGGQVGQVIHAYASAWLPQSLLATAGRASLVEALYQAGMIRGVSLHFNKGLAGGPDAVRQAARGTCVNPAVTDAFALAIAGAEEGPAYPGVPGHEPDVAAGRQEAAEVRAAMAPLMRLVDRPASYLSETDYFEADWQAAFWGGNYPRLRAIKARYDPEGLFVVHHGVGSEGWSADGFERVG